MTLAADTVVFSGIYLTPAPLVRAIIRCDVDLVEVTLNELAFIAKTATPFLRYERFLADLI